MQTNLTTSFEKSKKKVQFHIICKGMQTNLLTSWVVTIPNLGHFSDLFFR
jgi:hypothetical protein